MLLPTVVAQREGKKKKLNVDSELRQKWLEWLSLKFYPLWRLQEKFSFLSPLSNIKKTCRDQSGRGARTFVSSIKKKKKKLQMMDCSLFTSPWKKETINYAALPPLSIHPPPSYLLFILYYRANFFIPRHLSLSTSRVRSLLLFPTFSFWLPIFCEQMSFSFARENKAKLDKTLDGGEFSKSAFKSQLRD